MSFLHATCCSVPKLVNNVKISRFTPRKLENFPMKNVELFNKIFESENCFSRKLQIEFFPITIFHISRSARFRATFFHSQINELF